MARKRYTPETIIRKLREAEILQGQCLTIVQAVKKFGVSEQTFYPLSDSPSIQKHRITMTQPAYCSNLTMSDRD